MFRTNMRVCVLLLVLFFLNTHIRQVVSAAPLPLSDAPLVAKKPKAATGKPLHKIIDEQIQSQFKDQSKFVSAKSSDGEFLRRVYLDLTGRIPSVTQTREFLNDSRSEKRTFLVNQLLASPEYARYTSQQLDVMLMRRLR